MIELAQSFVHAPDAAGAAGKAWDEPRRQSMRTLMRYEPPLFRPPSEASSLILQATLGCSWNNCTY